jgi:hypothetical protein
LELYVLADCKLLNGPREIPALVDMNNCRISAADPLIRIGAIDVPVKER